MMTVGIQKRKVGDFDFQLVIKMSEFLKAKTSTVEMQNLQIITGAYYSLNEIDFFMDVMSYLKILNSVQLDGELLFTVYFDSFIGIKRPIIYYHYNNCYKFIDLCFF